MSMVSEFKQFAVRGNVVDLAVGIVIGGAFGKIVSSLVAQVLMPLLGVLIGGVDLSSLAITLKETSGETAAVMLNYGQFLQAIVDFLIIAFAIFLVVKLVNRLEREEKAKPAAAAEPPAQERLLAEIRDLLARESR